MRLVLLIIVFLNLNNVWTFLNDVFGMPTPWVWPSGYLQDTRYVCICVVYI